MGLFGTPAMNGLTLKNLSEGLLKSAGQTRLQGNLLEIHHPSAPVFDPLLLHSAMFSHGLSISISQDESGDYPQKLRCKTIELPFQEKSFEVVVLHHIVSDGSEPELREAVRVLARDGVLILLGLNRIGWRYRTQERSQRLPGLSPLKVKGRLESLQMAMRGFYGAGLGGMSRPAWMHSGLASLGAPFADVVLLQARRADDLEITPLQFRKSGSGIVQSAAMRG